MKENLTPRERVPYSINRMPEVTDNNRIVSLDSFNTPGSTAGKFPPREEVNIDDPQAPARTYKSGRSIPSPEQFHAAWGQARLGASNQATREVYAQYEKMGMLPPIAGGAIEADIDPGLYQSAAARGVAERRREGSAAAAPRS